MAVAMCATQNHYGMHAGHVDRYYSMEGTPSPPSSVPHVVPEFYTEFEDDAFHSDEELQKVSFLARLKCISIVY